MFKNKVSYLKQGSEPKKFKNSPSVFFIFLVSFCLNSWLAYGQSQSTLVDVNSQSQLHIECALADVVYSESGGRTLQIQSQLMENSKPKGSGWNFRVEKDAASQVIKVKCDAPESLVEKSAEKNSALRYQITLKGASIPLNANIRSGSISISNLRSPVSLTLERGSLKLSNTSQAAKLYMINGSIDVEQHNGRLKIEAFDAKLKLSQVDGNVDIHNFAGSVQMKDIHGEMNLNGQKSSFLVESSSGGLKFDMDAGKLELENYSGTIEGEAQETLIQAKLLNPVRFKLKGKTAQTRLQVPSSSGAQIFFSLSDGQFQVPAFLSQDNSANIKTVRGTLRGGETGRLHVTAETGRVQLSTY